MEASRAYNDFAAERVRAHALHGPGSMESRRWKDAAFLPVVGEEFGEVCKAWNEFALGNCSVGELRVDLRGELVQVGAMVAAWIDAIDAAEDSL